MNKTEFQDMLEKCGLATASHLHEWDRSSNNDDLIRLKAELVNAFKNHQLTPTNPLNQSLYIKVNPLIMIEINYEPGKTLITSGESITETNNNKQQIIEVVKKFLR
jgi:hypothetical protein